MTEHRGDPPVNCCCCAEGKVTFSAEPMDTVAWSGMGLTAGGGTAAVAVGTQAEGAGCRLLEINPSVARLAPTDNMPPLKEKGACAGGVVAPTAKLGDVDKTAALSAAAAAVAVAAAKERDATLPPRDGRRGDTAVAGVTPAPAFVAGMGADEDRDLLHGVVMIFFQDGV